MDSQIQEKISRGAAWNTAVAYLLAQKKEWKDETEFCIEVTKTAENIASFQSAFVNAGVKTPGSGAAPF